MEDLKNIEHLLEKYYNGETSLEEERKLRWYFQTHGFPERFQAEKRMHDYFQTKKKEILSPGLTNKLSTLIDNHSSNRSRMKTILLWAGSAAAVVIILLTVFLGNRETFSHREARFKDTYNDPMLAYLETRKALILVSEKLNEGTQNLQTLNKLDKGINNLTPVFSFGPGIQHLNKLSKFNEAIVLITK